LVEEDLSARAARLGPVVMERMTKLSERLEGVLADLRGKGLLVGLEFDSDSMGGLFYTELIDERVLTVPALNDFRMMRIAPPLNIPADVLEEGLNRVERAMERAVELHRQLE
jgi:putrescine aminotransferase